jgi:hypothetical protein
MNVGRTILALLIALSVAMLPAAGGPGVNSPAPAGMSVMEDMPDCCPQKADRCSLPPPALCEGRTIAFEGVEIMIFRITLAVAFLLSAASLADTAFAGADDYVFEPVKSEVKSSNVAMVAVPVGRCR